MEKYSHLTECRGHLFSQDIQCDTTADFLTESVITVNLNEFVNYLDRVFQTL